MAKDLSSFARENWFWIALVLVVIAGYQLGKDRALTLNQKEVARENS